MPVSETAQLSRVSGTHNKESLPGKVLPRPKEVRLEITTLDLQAEIQNLHRGH